ncbi:hypothetical protein MIMGU_mgv1a020244mg [Erythranthe guttata]|uniref:Protein kinase domain-containing protein n=1 Tax=Erythranthe guttata TaxID=4155 RepID=A0A022RK15_ERYGU|nr:hypothetical protein MIMGU_mgv1a020244mg [Erythranthe guttata]
MNLVIIKFLLFFFLFHSSIITSAVSNCPKSFECGSLGSLQFPLSNSTGCGLFTVDDCDSDNPTVQLEPGGQVFNISRNISTNSFLIKDHTLQVQLDNMSCFAFRNVSLPKSPSISFSVSSNLTMFACVNPNYIHDGEIFPENHRSYDCTLFIVYYGFPTAEVSPVPSDCQVIQLPVKPNYDQSSLENVFGLLTSEYILEWNVSENCSECHRGGGQCLTNNIGEFECKSADEKDIELFLKNNGNLAPKRYRYSDVKKFTKSFGESLGKGGYGSVYKGKLYDGRLVAVKMLDESKGNGDEFMNEVASISRTSHVNIVTLLGFCFEGSKRALIYEFMPNGSLEKFIQHSASSSSKEDVIILGWEKLFQIALGIARGLEYLHEGCNTRILHFDIKPHNILLDKDFNPKISDFGLAKLCPNRLSIVSMLVARGTIGYIAPEVFSRNFGEVSHKSDVYSYGMMILEIVGATKKNGPSKDVINADDTSSEVYFPQYIYKELELIDADLDGIIANNEDESEVITKRKLIIVGLWCIQIDPKDRPSMKKVLEMLEGKLENLQVPPKPYLSSPPRAPIFSISDQSM